MKLFKSRFTPNATGDEIPLNIGETVRYKLRTGGIVDAIIDSEQMTHAACPYKGYEAILSNTGERAFINGRNIIWWEGKT